MCIALFTIYVNDTCNASKQLKFILFADDTNIFHSRSHSPDLELNTKLNKMCKWFYLNKLSLNIAKTTYIILFARYNHQQNVTTNIIIQIVQATKFLGESLSRKNHINMVKSTLSKVASVMYKVSEFVDHMYKKRVIELIHGAYRLDHTNNLF